MSKSTTTTEPPKDATAPDAPCSSPLALRVEAALIATDRPISSAKLSDALGKAGTKAIDKAVSQLNELYEQTGRSFRIEQLAGGWQILTLADFQSVMAAMHQSRTETRLSAAALETLAIIAYRQPILRAQIETVRGVACGEVVRGLMERQLVKIAGRAEELGRPMLYGTTKRFLELFGMASLKDLPKVEELNRGSDGATERRSDEGGEGSSDEARKGGGADGTSNIEH